MIIRIVFIGQDAREVVFEEAFLNSDHIVSVEKRFDGCYVNTVGKSFRVSAEEANYAIQTLTDLHIASGNIA